MCLLFCFVLFWILCCVVCEKINKKLLITKKFNECVDDTKLPTLARVAVIVGVDGFPV